MDTQLMIQSTPNPNALKFVLNKSVKTEGNVTYKSAEECEENALAKAVFEIGAFVSEVYFFDNYITVTQDGSGDWDELEQNTRAVILDKIDAHNPDFTLPVTDQAKKPAVASSPDLDKINTVLDQTIRPALQMDGGDVQVLEYQDNKVKIFYQGACGTCPSSTMGTMYAIENILKEQFNPDVTVELGDPIPE